MDLLVPSARPFIWVAKLYGALPLTFKSSNIKLCICGLIYGIILCGSFCTYSFLIYYFFYSGVTDMVEYVLKVYVLLSCLFAAGCHSSYIIHIFRIRKLFENILKHSDRLCTKKYQKKVFLITTAESLVFWLVDATRIIKLYVFPSNAVFDMDFDQDGIFSEEERIINMIFMVMNALEEHYLVYVITMINLQFCNGILFLKSLIDVINLDLKRCLRNKAFVTRSEVTEYSAKNTSLMDEDGEISKLVQFYDEICDLCKLLNEYFNPTLLITSILTLTTTLLCLYFFITKVMEPVQFACNFSYCILNLWLILFCCENLVSEVRGYELGSFG